MLGINIVPRTEVVELTSPAFNNITQRTLDNLSVRINARAFPVKTGSFQTFIHGFTDAGSLLAMIAKGLVLKGEVRQSFMEQFQRMVILDFMIRNTDRNPDNWLIKIEYAPNTGALALPERVVTSITLRAIDNGLAFPIKHPDGSRKFPFQWATLSFAKEPFLPSAQAIISRLANKRTLSLLMAELAHLFAVDPQHTRELFESQMAVMLGQASVLLANMKGCPLDCANAPTQLGSMRMADIADDMERVAGEEFVVRYI